MKKITLLLSLIITISASNFLSAQNKAADQKLFGQDLTVDNQRSLEETGFIRCATTEYERSLQAQFPERASDEAFENWLAPKVVEMEARLASGRGSVQTIPVIFHILTDGAGDENLSQSQIQDQLDQLNIDYANLAGSPFAVAADTEIQFCLALQDEAGENLDEPGINRILDYGDTGQTSGTMNGGIKQATQWDPTKYMNIWVANLGGDLLGYAQFPDPTGSGLSGLDAGDVGPVGAADTDGVVVVYTSVGSIANPNPAGGQYPAGRTLTHEVGHWLGLRHIWGDGGCTVDDFCADTPNAGGSNFNCPTADSCAGGDADMVENYMDYTDDTCMNTFTNDQKTRVLAIMANAPRRMELATSTACQPGVIYDLDGKLDIEDLNVVDCGSASMTPTVRITNAGNDVLTSATISYYLDSDTPASYNWAGSLNIDEFEIVALPEVTTTMGAHTFNVELMNPNGGTDDNTANDTASASHTFVGGLCASEGNVVYDTSTEGVIINDGATDILSNINTGKPAGYNDYTAMVTDLNRESSYDFTTNVNTDGNYTVVTTVWIDWNQNCSFEDAGEAYDLGNAVNVANGPTANAPLAITVPTDAVLGNTTMRVTTQYNAAAGPCDVTDGSGASVDAEVEDYTINVLTSLSVDEYALNSISIYPNPTNGILNISLSNGNDLPDGYKIYNMLGQAVSEKAIGSISDLSVNTSALSNGMYFIRISKGGSQVSLPFLKK